MKTINKVLVGVAVMILILLSSCTKDEPTILDELTSEKSWVMGNGRSFIEFNHDSNVFVQATLINNGECYYVFNGADYGYVVTVVTDNESLLELSIEDNGIAFTRMMYRNDNGDMVWKSLYENGSISASTIIVPSSVDFSTLNACN
tara:strand:- start:240 stop:677 length:438 start_codon:yes stop_codon:yes gene_type:complete